MPLVPKPHLVGKSSQSKGQATAATTTGKQAQRERNKAAGLPKTNSGSSGRAIAISRYPSVDWSTIEAIADHIVDVTGVISHSQMGTTGNVSMSVNVPSSYALAAVQAHLATIDGMAYIRIYKVGPEKFIEEMERLAELAAQEESDSNG